MKSVTTYLQPDSKNLSVLSTPLPYTVDHNQGSGKLDYIAIDPTMDLSLYTGKGYLFRADFYLGGLTGSHEELFLTGAFAPQGETNTVPEPTSMLLLDSGLAALTRFKRKKN